MFKNKTIDLIVVILFVAFGVGYRIQLNSDLNQPLADGGMFYSMMRDIITSNFSLPIFTSYNNLNIPFTYPPLGLYIGAVFLKLGVNINTIEVYIPLLFSIASIVAFYFLANTLLEKKYANLAVLIFLIEEQTYESQILGGGITRSLGFFFCILSIYFFLKTLKNRSNLSIVGTSLFFSLTILSHFEWAFFVLFSMALFSVFSKNIRKNIKDFGLIFSGALVLTSPWWIKIFMVHSTAPFWYFLKANSAVNVGPGWTLIALLSAFYTAEGFIALLRVFSFLGIIFSIKKGYWAIILWLIIPLVLFPGGYFNMASIPVSFLCAIAIQEIVEHIDSIKTRSKNSVSKFYKHDAFLGIILIFVASSSYMNFGNLSSILNDPGTKNLTDADIKAMDWVNKSVKSSSKFLLLTKNSSGYSWSYDKTSEWFPSLTNQESIVTPQGSEWLPNNAFGNKLLLYRGLRRCYKQNIECIEQLVANFDLSYDYIYLQTFTDLKNYPASLAEELKSSSKYVQIFKNDSVIIFKKLI